MRAYKVWEDEKNYIRKDSDAQNVFWTTDPKEAKSLELWSEAYNFFFETLGFHINESLPNSLKLEKN